MQGFVFSCQLQVCLRRLLRFFDEAVQQNHPTLHIDIKHYACDTMARQCRAYFIKSITKRTANGHSQGLAEFYRLNINPDLLTVLHRSERFKPVSYRLVTGLGSKEDNVNAFELYIFQRNHERV